jgi:hypothetical protein
MAGEMLGQTGQCGVNTHVTGTAWRFVKQARGGGRPLPTLRSPVVVKELHQASVRAAETTAAP